MDEARFLKEGSEGCDVQIECRIPESVRAEPATMRDQIRLRGDFGPGGMGRGEVAMRDSSRLVNSAASDPRKHGEAIPGPRFGGANGAGPQPLVGIVAFTDKSGVFERIFTHHGPWAAHRLDNRVGGLQDHFRRESTVSSATREQFPIAGV